MIEYDVISTGSKGNAVAVNGYVLIDCGVPFEKLKEVYKGLKIVLLTHIHRDHFLPQTIKRLAFERPSLRFGCCEWLLEDLIKCGVERKNIDVFQIGKVYDYKIFKLAALKLFHDVPQCGYRLYFGNEKAMYATDTRTMEGISAKNYDLYMIEANYEEWELRERIKDKVLRRQYSYELSVPYRHLSEEQAKKWLAENNSGGGEVVFLHRHE